MQLYLRETMSEMDGIWASNCDYRYIQWLVIVIHLEQGN